MPAEPLRAFESAFRDIGEGAPRRDFRKGEAVLERFRPDRRQRVRQRRGREDRTLFERAVADHSQSRAEAHGTQRETACKRLFADLSYGVGQHNGSDGRAVLKGAFIDDGHLHAVIRIVDDHFPALAVITRDRHRTVRLGAIAEIVGKRSVLLTLVVASGKSEQCEQKTDCRRKNENVFLHNISPIRADCAAETERVPKNDAVRSRFARTFRTRKACAQNNSLVNFNTCRLSCQYT